VIRVDLALKFRSSGRMLGLSIDCHAFTPAYLRNHRKVKARSGIVEGGCRSLAHTDSVTR
jgi:hypothetical protein